MTGPRRLVIIGHGYSAGFITPLMVAAGWQVIGTTRGTGRGAPDRVAQAGAQPLVWDGHDPAPLNSAIRDADAVLSSVSPVNGTDPILPLIAEACPPWVGYLSSTAVYGDAGGAWVDENSPTSPNSARGQARLTAEAAWQGLASGSGASAHIFRLAGIYGPGRSALDRLRNGTARRIIKPGQVFSRIHAEDIAHAVRAALAHPQGGVWNLADDHPAAPQDVIADAARMVGLPIPPDEDFATADLSPMAREFYADSRRISNARIRRELGWAPAYPDHRAGLLAILRAGG